MKALLMIFAAAFAMNVMANDPAPAAAPADTAAAAPVDAKKNKKKTPPPADAAHADPHAAPAKH